MFKLTVSDVSVYLCRSERGMSEELLDRAYRGAGVEHVGRERMAQHMGTQARGVDVSLGECLVDHRVDQTPVERTPVLAHHQGRFAVGGGDGGRRRGVAQTAVAVDGLHKLRADGDYPFLITLSEHL